MAPIGAWQRVDRDLQNTAQLNAYCIAYILYYLCVTRCMQDPAGLPTLLLRGGVQCSGVPTMTLSYLSILPCMACNKQLHSHAQPACCTRAQQAPTRTRTRHIYGCARAFIHRYAVCPSSIGGIRVIHRPTPSIEAPSAYSGCSTAKLDMQCGGAD